MRVLSWDRQLAGHAAQLRISFIFDRSRSWSRSCAATSADRTPEGLVRAFTAEARSPQHPQFHPPRGDSGSRCVAGSASAGRSRIQNIGFTAAPPLAAVGPVHLHHLHTSRTAAGRSRRRSSCPPPQPGPRCPATQQLLQRNTLPDCPPAHMVVFVDVHFRADSEGRMLPMPFDPPIGRFNGTPSRTDKRDGLVEQASLRSQPSVRPQPPPNAMANRQSQKRQQHQLTQESGRPGSLCLTSIIDAKWLHTRC